MNIALIGAGIIGVTTAYELAADGHQVTVFERCGAVAEEASFATGGLISPTCQTPWTGAPTARRVLRQWWNPLHAQHLGPRLGARQLGWMWRWLRAARTNAQTTQREPLLALARYSLQRQQRLRSDLALDYEHSTGCLVMLRDADDLARACSVALWRGQAQRTYNVCDDAHLLMGDYFDLAADLYGLPRPPRVARAEAREQLPVSLLSFMSESRRLLNQRLKAELRLRLQHPSVATGLRGG